MAIHNDFLAFKKAPKNQLKNSAFSCVYVGLTIHLNSAQDLVNSCCGTFDVRFVGTSGQITPPWS
jgi:hypothetical protein